MVNKRGYIQTLEAVVAILILLSVILFSISLRGVDEPRVPEDIALLQKNILGQVQNNQEYRDCVFYVDTCSGFSSLFDLIPETIDKNYTVDDSVFIKTDVNLYVDSVIIVNETNSAKTFTLYLWRK
ncbi:hypothetical protein HON86_03310 [Candidatus Woesearchaeota archaeon]|nr:hypothetical protein [Candidatus Woesearchaeota archaeon]